MRVLSRADRPISLAAGAFQRSVGASDDVTGAERLWVAEVEMAARAVSRPHHHADCETSIYIIEGRARFYAGNALDQVLEAGAGDFVWVPSNEVHVEQNTSADQPLRMIVTRSPRDITVEVAAPAGWAAAAGR